VKDFETSLDKKLMFQNNSASRSEISGIQSLKSTTFSMQISPEKTGSQTQPGYRADTPVFLIKIIFLL